MTSAILIFIMAGCDNAKDGIVENLIYINEASSAKSKDITLQPSGNTRTTITVRIARALDHHIQAELFIDKTLLAEYNRKHETNYKAINPQHITFPEKITIKAGSISADPINIDIAEFDDPGVQYAIPIAIKNVVGGIEKAQSSSKFVIALVKPLQQSVPTFQYFNKMQADPSQEWGLILPNYTLEWWCKMSAFSVNNQAIFNSGGGDTNLYIRFGDLVYAQGSRYVYNFLQIKTMGTQFDSGDPTAGKGLEANKWYHFAITYDAATGISLLYVDGVQTAQLGTSAGKPMRFDRFQMVSSGAQYFKDKCELAQVRLWKTTRTANQIRKNMYSAVEYTNSDLVLYLPMDQANSTNNTDGTITLLDVSGNNHHVQIGNLMNTGDIGYNNKNNISWNTYLFAR